MGGPGGPGSGTGGGRFHHQLPKGAHAFDMASSDPVCDRQAQLIAKPVLEHLRRYVAAYEAKTPLPEVPGFFMTSYRMHAGPLKYWIEIEPTDRAALVKNGHAKAIFACSYIHDMGHGEVMSLHIDATRQMFLGYAPGIGLFSVHH